MSHLDHWSPIFLTLIFLLKNKASEVGAQEIYSRFIKLFSEDFRVEIVWVFDMLVASMELLSHDHLGDFENYSVSFF